MHTADALPSIGVVLAGGRSRRMGRDKALLNWHGRPLIEHQIDMLREACVDRVRVSGSRPDYHGIADARPDAGPLAGLATVAATLSTDAALLVIPVDMPLISVDLLHRLRTEQPHAACLRPAGHVLPLRLRIDTDTRHVLDALIRADVPQQRSLRALQQALDAGDLPLDAAEAAQLTDCNTPETWHEVAT